ncbi:uncharacterized protein LOC144169447 isoform X3 [Haemaphysalis longicornis]
MGLCCCKSSEVMQPAYNHGNGTQQPSASPVTVIVEPSPGGQAGQHASGMGVAGAAAVGMMAGAAVAGAAAAAHHHHDSHHHNHQPATIIVKPAPVVVHPAPHGHHHPGPLGHHTDHANVSVNIHTDHSHGPSGRRHH